MVKTTSRRALRVALLLAVLIGLSSEARTTNNQSDISFESRAGCSLAGTWLGRNDFGEHYVLTIAPLGRGLNQFSVVSGGGPTALFPSFRGVAGRNGHNRYELTQVALARVDENGLPSDVGTDLVIVVTGVGEVSSSCDQLILSNLIANLYLLDLQDPFGSDPPIATFGPASASYRRVPLIPQPD